MGTTFKWMWIDLKVETEFKELFEPEAMPGVVVFNPHKRLRFTKLEGKTASAQSIRELIDKIQGGDARFTMVKGQKRPVAVQKELGSTFLDPPTELYVVTLPAFPKRPRGKEGRTPTVCRSRLRGTVAGPWQKACGPLRPPKGAPLRRAKRRAKTKATNASN